MGKMGNKVLSDLERKKLAGWCTFMRRQDCTPTATEIICKVVDTVSVAFSLVTPVASGSGHARVPWLHPRLSGQLGDALCTGI